MAGRYQRPQIMPPGAGDLRSMESMARYIDRMARQMNNALADIYAKMNADREKTEKAASASQGPAE